jgi:Bardet-Biedl syndrome 9 protein
VADFHVLRYQVLAEAGSMSDDESASGRKVATEWSYDIGEAALDVVAVTWANSYCDILVLGERNLFCLKDNGTLKFMKRLEYKPCCFHPYFIGKFILFTSYISSRVVG